MQFSIIDVETTGVYRKTDRIIEIAIVKLNRFGGMVDSYTTLVNPMRDVGAYQIHGITATAVKNAPTFSEIAPTILDVLNNSILVAHNKRFDLGFIEYELNKSGYEVDNLDGICTLSLSKRLFPELPSRKLSVLCEYLDVMLEDAHSAYYDCMATSQLFCKMLDTFESDYGQEEFNKFFTKDKLFCYPGNRTFTKIEFKRSDAEELINKEEEKLKAFLKRIPDNYKSEDYNISEYLNLLDRILEDRIITDNELSELAKFAHSYQISAESLNEIHYEYFRRLVRYYLADDILTKTELVDLHKVAKLLQIDAEKRDMIINLEGVHLSIGDHNSFRDTKSYEGESVCFTGQLISRINGNLITRELAHAIAIEKGLTVKKGVTKKLDLLVVADPNTQSTKAKKAREYGVKVIAEPVFWNNLGVCVE